MRFEEITRCPLEVQDSLLSVLSDRVLAVPELDERQACSSPASGFNVIATANTRDRGVNEMSAALKRRFNFETVFPIADYDVELALVREEAAAALARSGVPAVPGRRRARAAGHDLPRAARGRDARRPGDRAAVQRDVHRRGGVRGARGRRARRTSCAAAPATPADVVECLLGTAIKDDAERPHALRRYFEQRVAKRSGAHWKAFYEARHRLPDERMAGCTVVGVRHHSPACARLVRARHRRRRRPASC